MSKPGSGCQPLILGGFTLQAFNRQFPEATDYWDGNWLLVEATCGAGLNVVGTSGSFIHGSDLRQWIRQLAEWDGHSRLELKTLEEELALSISPSDGELSVEVQLGRLERTTRNAYSVPTKQLDVFCAGLHDLLECFPILGMAG